MKDALLLLGRILVAVLFVPAGFGKLMKFSGTVASIGTHLPIPEVMAAGAIGVELGVGLAFLIGWKGRWAALILALFTIVAALVFHNFWASPEAQFAAQKLNFLKNMAIAGALFFAYAHGPGRYSLDKR
jgi:putative oxidoreductase